MKQLYWLALVCAFITGCSGGNGSSTIPSSATGQPQSQAAHLKPLFNGMSDVVQSAVGHTHSMSTSCTLPNSPTAGNVLVFGVGIFSGANVTTTPSGVTTIDAPTNSQMRTYYRVVQTGDGTSWTFTTTVNSYLTVGCYEVAGANSSNPIDKHGTQNVSNSTTFTTPSETPTQSGDLPIAFFGNAQNGSFSNLTTGWADDINQHAGAFFEYGAHGPVAGTTAVQASVTIGAAGYGGAAIVLLNPAPASGGYFYHGVQVFNGRAGTADSIVNQDVSGVATDTNSATVINNTKTIFSAFTGAADTAILSRVNIATSTTPQVTVTMAPGGHNPPITTGEKCGTQPCKWYYANGFVFEGNDQVCTNASWGGDCHYDTLNTDTHEYDEGWEAGFGSNTFATHAGNSLNLDDSFATNRSVINSNWGLAGLPQLGFADMGEDASLSVINHPLKNFIPSTSMMNGSGHAIGYSGGTGFIGTTNPPCNDVTKCLEIGDVLVLIANDYSGLGGCADAHSVKVIHQLEHYGSPVSDVGSSAGFYFGQNTSGTNPWSANVTTCLGHILYNTTNWRLLDRSHF